MTTAEQLEPLVRAWLPVQRWFAGKGRDADFHVDLLDELQQDPEVAIWLVRADYGGGETETYQLPLTIRREPAASLEHVQLGTLDAENGPCWVYDALHDKDLTPLWLTGMRDETMRSGGRIRFHRYADADHIPVDQPSLVLSGEQSNTSMVFGDAAIMKVFRRLQPGTNPDIEIGAALTELGAKHVPTLLGAVEADVDGAPSSLAMLQEFLTSGTDGWELAKTSVRDLMAERDLHAEEAGGDFAAEAERLGQAVAETHLDLATAFGTSRATPEQLRDRAATMRERLARALPIVPDLEQVADQLNRIFAAVGELADSGSDDVLVQRIHGDLHLGQVLRTVYRWVLIDFEGEPMAAMEARREMDSPLRDVAGMLRSFDYAGYHRVVEFGGDAQLTYRAHEWSQRNRTAFCDGYAEAAGFDPRAQDVLLRAFEADKAVYEAVYEARNRPSWLAIPLASLTRLATDDGGRS